MHRPSTSKNNPIDHFYIEFENLKSNKLQELSRRKVEVWRPEGISTDGLPLLICLASYLNSGPSLTAWRLFGETIPERLDRLYQEEKLPPALIVFVDSFNRLGGTQFVNSPVIGNWVDALADELVPELERKYNAGGKGNRALFGHSSGGYGALYNLATRPDVWSGAASHAGDCGFDFVYRAELPKTLRVLSQYDYNFENFLEAFWQQEKPKGEQVSALMVLALSASYDPCEKHKLGLRLPIDPITAEFIKERWENWLAHDLLSFDKSKMQALKSAKTIYFDCGREDEYNILYGSRRFSRLLKEQAISHRFEEFDGGHGTIGPRYEISLPYLLETLKK